MTYHTGLVIIEDPRDIEEGSRRGRLVDMERTRGKEYCGELSGQGREGTQWQLS